jgi:hypothetical protein
MPHTIEAYGFVGVSYEGCSHYKRKCQVLAPCCDTFYPCRFCHDETCDEQEKDTGKQHTLVRNAVVTVKCMRCGEIQPSEHDCSKCRVALGTYFCSMCNLYDDEDKKQFHCEKCAMCRVGGAEKYVTNLLHGVNRSAVSHNHMLQLFPLRQLQFMPSNSHKGHT